MADGVKSALRTLRLFQLYARCKVPLPLTELARHLDMPLSSCHALVSTLVERGFMYEVDRRTGYYPTARMLHYAQEVTSSDPFLARLEAPMRALRDACGETVVLARRQGDKALYLRVLESPQAVRFTATAGDLRPLHAAAAGKAVLDALPISEQQALLASAGMPAFTPRTLVRFEDLRANLDQARERGWYVSLGETVADATAVAMQLHIRGDVLAISILGPMARVKEALTRHVERLREFCRREGLGAAQALDELARTS